MAEQPKSRQDLYDRIRKSSRDEVILEEMIRLGFWPKTDTVPGDPADEIRRRGELERKLRDLRTQSSRLKNIDALEREMRKKRMAESRQRRQETKERRQRERDERAKAHRERQKTTIDFLGEGVSGGLRNTAGNADRLTRNGLPSIHTAADLANAMGTFVGELRFLAFTRSASKVTHYQQFTLVKKGGGKRLISAPRPRLKAVQYWILDHVLTRPPIHEAAHGFVPGRSILSNATPHTNADVVVNLDLKDFFPTLTYRRVKGLFCWLGFSESVATLLGLLCTEPRRREVKLDGETYYVTLDERILPQGAPTSPAITNLICRNLDSRIQHISQKLGFVYTRYADDLSFSGRGEVDVGRLLRQVRHVIRTEGFVIHPDKTRVLRRGRRQEVTGIVVNEFPNISRDVLRRFRATLFQIEKDGPAGKHWGNTPDVIAAVEGFANYVAMVNPERGRSLQARVQALVNTHGKRPAPKKRPRPVPRPPQPEPAAATPSQPASVKTKSTSTSVRRPKRWWQFWK